MRIAIVGLLHVELAGFIIHFLDKSLVKLSLFYFGFFLFIFLYVCGSTDAKCRAFVLFLAFLLLDEDSAAPNCDGQTCIVSARQHQSMQQLLNCIYLALLDVGRSSSDILLEKPNLHNFLIQIK